MDREKIVAYCGIYCGPCAANARIPQTARQLRDYLEHGAYEEQEGRQERGFSYYEIHCPCDEFPLDFT